jgi:RND family efflux transporter MFP subunit
MQSEGSAVFEPMLPDSPAVVSESNAPVQQPPARSVLRKLVCVPLFALVFGAGWLVHGSAGDRADKETLPSEAAWRRSDAAPVAVTVEPVTFRPVQRSVEGIGSLHGFEEVTISARVEGRVQKLAFDVADRVRPGDVLLEIDPTDYELSVQQADRALLVELAKLGLKEMPARDFDLKAVPTVVHAGLRLQNLKNKLVRVEKMWQARATSGEDWENARAEHGMAEAEYANQLLIAQAGFATVQLKQAAFAVARQQLKDAQVRVPQPTRPVPGATDGVSYAVTQRAVAEGSLVRPGAEVCRLVINQTLKLRIPVPERYSTEVQPGQTAEVQTAASAQSFAGTVSRVNPAVDPATRTFEVEVQVPNPDGILKPGGFAKAAIHHRVDAEAATVPLSALVSFAGITKVFLLEDGKAREVQVTPGVQTTEWVEIARPALPRGGRVVTSGQTALAAGTPVAVRAAGGTN